MKNYPTLIVIFVLGSLAGYVFGASQQARPEPQHDAMEMTEDHPHEEGTAPHAHEDAIEVDAETGPSVMLEAFPDSVSGFNLRAVTRNFTFTPEDVGKAHVDGTGHGHVYVDDTKVGRIYGEWYLLDKLAPGAHEVTVTLTSNDHRDYTTGGEIIADSLMIEIE